MSDEGHFEDRVREIGRSLIEEVREREQHFWAREHWEELVFRRIMSDASFRVQLLRFIDVLPSLKSDAQITAHLDEYLGADELPMPELIKWGIDHVQAAGAAPVAGGAVRLAMHHLARRFVGGSNESEVIASLARLRERRLAASIDLLGEVTLSEHEADAYAQRYLAALEALNTTAAEWEPIDFLDVVGGRVAPRVNLSVKLSAFCPFIEPAAPGVMVEQIKNRVRPLLERARQLGASVTFDMEPYNLREITLQVFRELAMEPAFREWPDVGIALQAYLRETERDLESLIEWAKKRTTPVTVRLVRGAYWDQETVLARQHGWPMPVWEKKEETDLNYERCLHLLFDQHPHVEAAVGTHNVRSIALALALGEQHGLAHDQCELQMLYGMADPLKDAVAKRGHRVRVYVPYGELLPGMAYLVRRILENTESQSFLRMSFAEERPIEELLAPPQAAEPDEDAASPQLPSPSPLRNEPMRRFTARVERERTTSAIEEVRGRLGEEYPILIYKEHVSTSDILVSINPARPDETVGRVYAAGTTEIDAAVDSATQALPDWHNVGARERANYLLRTAELLRQRREAFAAWEIFEAGKTWREADADVTEAIDFLEYYAREAIRLDVEQVLDVAGETNRYGYQPRGVAVIIPPWNFPLAIPVGMLGAALAAGNTALLKPAPQTPVIAAQFVAIMHEAGLPAGVLNFVPGRDEVIGDHLVQHPGIHLVAFTGSREVGMRIGELVAHAPEGQHHIKRVVAEMGGKNAVIIDRDADLDEAVSGVVASAFGYAGQKCSAASRVIVLESIYDDFVPRLVEATRSLRVGDPSDPATFVGPVIDAAAQAKIVRAIEEGRSAARVLLETDVSGQGNGFYVGPTILAEAAAQSALAQEEIFGPVLLVMRAASFDEAIALANGTPYALTGGLYSRRPSHIEQAKRELEVGNVYINRKITGAIVGRQPFGGFKLSGIGSKAGGPDYLQQFVQPRTVTENTSRRGFAPEMPPSKGSR